MIAPFKNLQLEGDLAAKLKLKCQYASSMGSIAILL